MKYVKMLGLAAVAAAALMAFVGASTASATVLCANNGSTTACSSKYAAGTAIKAENEGTATLTTSFKNIECTGSNVEGTTSNTGKSGEAVSGSVSSLTFTGCNCEVKVLKTGSLSVTWISGTDNGTLKSSGAEVTANCSTIFGTVHCIYATSSTDLGTLTGGTTAKMDISSADIPRLTTNALCDESANWDATYKVTSPDSLFVADA
jgi:hypothetical protein